MDTEKLTQEMQQGNSEKPINSAYKKENRKAGTYIFQGRSELGELIKGELEAESSDSVAAQLLKRNITPIAIYFKPQKTRLSDLLKIDIFPSGVKHEDLIIFCRQMYTLTKAGVPIVNALSQIIESTRSKVLSRTLQNVVEEISGGQNLAAALKKNSKVFPPVFVSIVDAGENSGQLDVAFQQLSDYLELEADTIRRVKSATRYPTMVIGAIVVALLVVNFLVVPAFTKMFNQFGGKLPLPTRILMGSSDFLVHNWLLLLIAIIILFCVARYYLRVKKIRLLWDKFKLKIPVFGAIMGRISLARFSRTFSMMIQTGVPLIQGISLVAETVGNAYIRSRILSMRDAIERGETFTQTAKASQLFAPFVLQMLVVGEEAGTIDTMLEEIAKFYESEVDYDLRRLGDLIEPFLLIIMGAMVLVLALGVFLPMWDMVKFAKVG